VVAGSITWIVWGLARVSPPFLLKVTVKEYGSGLMENVQVVKARTVRNKKKPQSTEKRREILDGIRTVRMGKILKKELKIQQNMEPTS
jgi:hypothetical protein